MVLSSCELWKREVIVYRTKKRKNPLNEGSVDFVYKGINTIICFVSFRMTKTKRVLGVEQNLLVFE